MHKQEYDKYADKYGSIVIGDKVTISDELFKSLEGFVGTVVRIDGDIATVAFNVGRTTTITGNVSMFKKHTPTYQPQMTLNDYQQQAMTTCMATSENFGYMFLNLIGEVGEFASKIAKHLRKDEMQMMNNDIDYVNIDEESATAHHDELKKEAGDILWQLSGLCEVMGWSLEDVARQNLEKLASRKIRNVIDGNGDNR